MFIRLSPSVQVTDADRVRAHLTCDKGHVLFDLGHYLVSMLVMGHFAIALPNCRGHSYMPTTSPFSFLSLLISRLSVCSP